MQDLEPPPRISGTYTKPGWKCLFAQRPLKTRDSKLPQTSLNPRLSREPRHCPEFLESGIQIGRGSTGVQRHGCAECGEQLGRDPSRNWELQKPCFDGFFWGGNNLGLVPASLPHAFGYACTFMPPLSSPKQNPTEFHGVPQNFPDFLRDYPNSTKSPESGGNADLIHGSCYRGPPPLCPPREPT